MSSLLTAEEAFTALASGPLFCVVGTSFGSVHVVSIDGDFIQSFPSGNNRAVITQICIVEELVVFSNSVGQIICWDWRAVRHFEVSPLSGMPVHSMAVPVGFSWSSGNLYCSKSPGIVHCRTRDAFNRFGNSVVFQENESTAEFDRLFSGLFGEIPSDSAVATESYNHEVVQSMECDEEYLFFPFKEHVDLHCNISCDGRYAYQESRKRITARFGEFSRYDPDSVDGSKRCNLGIALGGGWLLIHWGGLIMLCDRRNFHEHPFRVIHQCSVGSGIQRVSLIADQVVVFVDTTINTDADDGPADELVSPDTSWHESISLSPRARRIRSKQHVNAKLSVDVLGTEARIYSETLKLECRFTFPVEVGRAIGARFSQTQQAPMLGLDGKSIKSTHCHVLYPKSFFLLRILTASEQILWLVKQQRYPLAMHLCQTKYQREQVFLEVAGMHANSLWRKGRHEEAVRVWGEVHLPSAPPLYWKMFVDRLDAAGKIDLAVKWLPFNDRTKVGHEVYERMLISAIDKGDYLTLLARIARWPILYKIRPILLRIFAILRVRTREAKLVIAYSSPSAEIPNLEGLKDVKIHPHPNPRMASYVLLITLFKLYEFANQFWDAAQILIQLERLRTACINPSIIDPMWRGDDESHTFALEKSVKTIDKTRATDYMSSKRLWGILTKDQSIESTAMESPLPGSRRTVDPSAYFNSLQSMFVLSPQEFAAHLTARRVVLSTLLAVDAFHTLSEIVEHSAPKVSNDTIQLIESVSTPDQLVYFLKLCVEREIELEPRHKDTLQDASFA